MKKIYLLVLIFAIKANVYSQVVLTQKDSIKVGTNIAFSIVNDTSVLRGFLLKNFLVNRTGAGNFWDFTNLEASYYDTAKFIDPKKTYYSSDFTDCNLASGDIGGFYNGFYKTDSSGFYQIGMGGLLQPSHILQGIRLNHPRPIFTFPANEKYSQTDYNKMRTKVFIENGDSTYHEEHIQTQRDVIATGQIQLPFGKFDAFLLKETISVYDTTWYKYNDSTWTFVINVWNGGSPNYEWYCNNSTFMVASLSGLYKYPDGIERIERIAVQMNNYANLKSISVNDIEPTKINIYPNPASSKLFIENLNLKNSSYVITDISGREIKNDKLQAEINIEDLQQGMYIINLYNQTELLGRKKFVKQ